MQDLLATQRPNILQRERQDGDRRAIAGHHLDGEGLAICIQMHDRAHVTFAQAMFGHVSFQGHKIELIRDNLAKTLKLVIDGVEVASQPRAMQHDITLTATLVHEGVSHRVVARSIVGRTTSGTVVIDGAPLTIVKT